MASGYLIECRRCNEKTWARNIVALIGDHTDTVGHLLCAHCGSTNAFIWRKSKLQEAGETFERDIRAVIPITTPFPTYTPYVFLTANPGAGQPRGVHFNYYKQTTKGGKVKLKHGHGPGGSPVLSRNELLQLLKKLGRIGFLTAKDLEGVARVARGTSTHRNPRQRHAGRGRTRSANS